MCYFSAKAQSKIFLHWIFASVKKYINFEDAEQRKELLYPGEPTFWILNLVPYGKNKMLLVCWTWSVLCTLNFFILNDALVQNTTVDK